MTGKTHMAISAATVAVVLSATGARASKGIPFLPPPTPDPGASQTGVYAIAGLLLLGVVAGLFPDLDAPDTELQHLPRRAADHVGWYITAAIPGMLRMLGLHGYSRSSRSSPLAWVVQGSIHLVALPFTLLVGAIGVGLRASPLGTGHRGFTHTLWGTLLFTSLAASVALFITGSAPWALIVGAVWLLGYASHLAADACTPSGIPLFMSPLALKRLVRTPRTTAFPTYPTFHLLPKRMWVRTGTMADTLVLRWAGWTVCVLAVLSMFAA